MRTTPPRRPPRAASPRSLRTLRSFAATVVLALCSATATAGELTVSAAASLTNAFKEVGSAYQAATGTHVQLNFAASGALLQQIVHGAPVDVFASADEETMDQAGRHQVVVPGSRIDFTANSLVVVVPRDAAVLPRSLSALTSADIRRVAIGLPASVPVGRYAKAALERAALWAAIEAKVIGAQSVRQVLDYVARGEVDAGFVYATDAALMPGQVRVAFTVATASPVRYPIAAVAGSSALAEARRFIAFVASAPGQAILAKYGFGPP